METTATELRRNADNFRSNGAYEAAGDTFTQAFYSYLGESEYGNDIRNNSVGQGLYCLLGAALCYRIDGAETRAGNRCRQGVLIVSDLREYVTEESALTGLLYEYQGDFECIAGSIPGEEINSRIDTSYRHAIEEYVETDHLDMWQSEPAFEWIYAYFIRVTDASSYTIDNSSVFHRSPIKRVEYKQRRFQEIIGNVAKSNQWNYDTTF